jgi:hypothetical protein
MIFDKMIITCISVYQTQSHFVFVNIDWDPNNVRSYLMKWFIMKA